MLKPIWEEARKKAEAFIAEQIDALVNGKTHSKNVFASIDTEQLKERMRVIVREFAKLDGYDGYLRSNDVKKREGVLTESKCWFAPVRVFKRDEEWESQDGKLKGSHDELGRVRPEYIAETWLYEKDGTVKPEYLDSDCIEANNFNLSAACYKLGKIVGSAPAEKPMRYESTRHLLIKQLSEKQEQLLAAVYENKDIILLDEVEELDVDLPSETIRNGLPQLAAMGLLMEIRLPSENGGYASSAFRPVHEEDQTRLNDLLETLAMERD